jgi:hypothetical protein
MMRRAFLAVVLLSLAVLAAGPGLATSWTSAIADDGTAYLVRHADDGRSLQLEIHAGEEDLLLLTVPETGDAALEEAPSLTVEGEAVYLVWSARRTIHSMLYVTSWSPADGWSEVFEFSGDPFSTKMNPQIAVTRDRYLTLEGEQPVEHNRAVLHLVWWDESGSGYRPLYLPLIVVDRALQPFDRPLDLYELTAATDTVIGDVHPSARRPVLEAHGSSFRIGVTGPDGAIAGIFDGQVPSGSLGFLADEARAQVVIFGSKNPEAPRSALASHVLTVTYELGRRVLAEDVAAYIAGQVAKTLLELPSDSGLQSLADQARAQVIIFGSRFQGGLRSLHREARAQVVIFGQRDDGVQRHAPVLASTSLHELPAALPADRDVQTFLGPERMIFAWDGGPARVRFVEIETGDGAAPEPRLRSLRLSEAFDRDAAYDSLARRARQD